MSRLHKHKPGSGAVIAILGVDGAGKSSLLSSLAAWLSDNRDVSTIYFGSGDGPMSMARRVVACSGKIRHTLLGFLRNRQTTALPPIAIETTTNRKTNSFRLRFFLDCLLIAWERQQSTKRMLKARKRGDFVLADRFPQAQFPGSMDGPKLHELSQHRFWLVRRLARWEYRTYEFIEINGPDLVAILTVSAETAARRSNNHSLDQLKQRIREIEDFEFPNSKVVHIDAEQPFDIVMTGVKRIMQELWPQKLDTR